MCFHVRDALAKGSWIIQVFTVDTDVVVILIGVCGELLTMFPTAQIWVSFGMGDNFQQIHINTVCSNLGDFKARALPGFHAFSGCDTTSQFYDKAEKLAWEAWKSYPEVTAAFNYMKEQPFKAIEQDLPTFKLLERFTCVLYGKTSNLESINEQRQDLFSSKSMALMNIPPTEVSNKLISGI